MDARQRIFVALDTPEVEGALQLVARLRGAVGGFKVGLELFGAGGPDVVRRIVDQGEPVFLDLKLHDIPNTVAGAADAIARLGISYFTLHAAGGARMIERGVEAARQAAEATGLAPPVALAVTVLTSHDDEELERIGLAGPCDRAVLRLAQLALSAGAGGLVCSPLELHAIRPLDRDALLVVPGIRPSSATVASDDQSRTATPRSAVASGADRLVIGRPITRATDPVAAARQIAAEIDA